MSELNQFDTGREIDISIPGPSGLKKAVLRFPTDLEWIERAAAQKIVIKQLGREKSQTDVPDSELADFDLFGRIRIDQDGEPWDKFEAAVAISKLSRAIAQQPAMDGSNYVIELTVPGGVTTHTLRPPSVGQMAQYRRARASAMDMPYDTQVIRVRLQPAADLYDALMVSVAGYASAVPIIHKTAVLRQLEREYDALIEGDGSGF